MLFDTGYIIIFIYNAKKKKKLDKQDKYIFFLINKTLEFVEKYKQEKKNIKSSDLESISAHTIFDIGLVCCHQSEKCSHWWY